MLATASASPIYAAPQLFSGTLNSNQIEAQNGSPAQRGYGLGFNYNYLFDINNFLIGPGARLSYDTFSQEGSKLTFTEVYATGLFAYRATKSFHPYAALALSISPFNSVSLKSSVPWFDGSTVSVSMSGTETVTDIRLGMLYNLSASSVLDANMVFVSNHSVTFTDGASMTTAYTYSPLVSLVIGVGIITNNAKHSRSSSNSKKRSQRPKRDPK